MNNRTQLNQDLLIAFQRNEYELILGLVKQGINNYTEAFQYFLTANHYKGIATLLYAGVYPPQYMHDETCLHVAVRNNNPLIISLLPRYSAVPHLRNLTLQTPMNLAVHLRLSGCVAALKQPCLYNFNLFLRSTYMITREHLNKNLLIAARIQSNHNG